MWEKRVLFVDGEAIVIDKPAGIAVTTGFDGTDSLEDILHHFRFGFQRSPQPVHRLDRDTSGCLLLSRNPKAHRRFQRAFEDRRVRKTYVAVVEGVPAAPEGLIDLALEKVSTAADGWRMVARPSGKTALTRWCLIHSHDGRSLIRFMPETGRTHQLRVHAAEGLGMPIAGDRRYGGGPGPMLLHARALEVERDGKPPVAATAPLPDHFKAAGFGDVEL